MILNGINQKTVFILGSGCTKGALPHVIVKGKRIRPPLNSDFFKVVTKYVETCGSSSIESKRFDRLKCFFRQIPTIPKLPHMETAFSLLFTAKDFPKIYSARQGRQKQPGDKQEIEDFLKLTFNILTLLDDSQNGDTGYDEITNVLRPEDNIITLNYDTLLDSALVRKGWSPAIGYGIRGGKKKFKWKPDHTNPDLAKVYLLKLHGSLNWFVRGSFSNLGAVFQKKPTKIQAPRTNEIKNHVRQIVPPIYGKFFNHDHWRALWTRAYKALCDADILIIVGCSLVDTDFHLSALIGRTVHWRKENGRPFKKVFFVDRLKIRKKWMRGLKGAYKKKITYKTFEAFIRKEVK